MSAGVVRCQWAITAGFWQILKWIDMDCLVAMNCWLVVYYSCLLQLSGVCFFRLFIGCCRQGVPFY